GAPAPGAKGVGSVVGVWLRFRTVGGAPTGNRGWRRRPDGTRPGCEGGGLGGCGLTPLSHRGRCSYINQSRRRTPDGTRPGCEGGGLGGWGLTPLRTVGGAPTGNRGWRSTREGRSTRPGCEGGGGGGWGLTPLSHRGRCS